MQRQIQALLVLKPGEQLKSLQAALRAQDVEMIQAQSVREATAILNRRDPPGIVFSDIALPDGNWEDILELSSKSHSPVNTIVVSRLVDMGFYVKVIERGAFDFIAPPFNTSDLEHIIRTASWNVFQKQNQRAMAAHLSA